MNGVKFRLCTPNEGRQALAFINENFDWKLPVVNLPEYFNFYYRSGEQLQFAVAEDGGVWLAIVGYIRASMQTDCDVWASVWVAKKGHNGIGLELMSHLPALTRAQVVACNNIRANTMPLYRFLGWDAQRMGHFYRLAPLPRYQLARVSDSRILPVGGDLHLDTVNTATRLAALGMPDTPCTPKKDVWYLTRRYFEFPHLRYQVYSASEKGQLLAYLVARVADSGCGKVLRIVDYIGSPAHLPRMGAAIDRLLAESGAEYAELYCAGIGPELLAKAGFSERVEGSRNILPNYLNPPLFENTEYYYFTNRPDAFVMFKADGDQDRPNLTTQ